MRVLHLISGGDTGGAKTQVFSLIKGIQRGIDVRVICFMDGVFYREAIENGINIQLISQQKRYDLSVIDKLVDIIKTEKFDLIHSHGARANFITFLVTRKIKIATITTIHSDYRLDFKGSVYKNIFYTTLNAFSLRFIDYYICISQNFKEMMMKRGFKEDKLFTVYNGIDFEYPLKAVDRGQYLRSKGVDWQDCWPIIGILGRLHPVKDHKTFLKAAKLVADKYPSARFLIGGDGELENSLKNYSKELAIDDKVKFIGYEKDTISFFNAIDINVLTSLSESFPYVLLEGARQNKATVSSDVGGISDLIKEGETGHLFKVQNSQGLADKIIALIDNKQNIDRLGDNLNSYAKENFSTEIMGKNHIDIYRSILKK